MAIGPHPHIGLQTVTWLLEGETPSQNSGRLHGVQLWVALPEMRGDAVHQASSTTASSPWWF
jgi:redox-sensitive bicupin YhaK (pirin superfamily)